MAQGLEFEDGISTGSSSSTGSIEIISTSDVEVVQETKANEEYRWSRGPYHSEDYAEMPIYTKILVYFGFAVMIFFARISDWLRAKGFMESRCGHELDSQKDFISLENGFESMFVNNIYRIASDVVNRPIGGVPGAIMKLKDRTTDDYGWTHRYTGTESNVLNFGSYNYLGFSHNDGPCAQAAAEMLEDHGLHIGATRHEKGSHSVQVELESCVARYLGVEDAICFPMGFGTNSMNIPALVDKKSLILSDELNHASLVLGCRMSGATVKVFKHNDPADCERKLRNALCQPSPKTGEKYNKILIVIEGIYSMEGTIVNLPAFIEVKKKYNAYMFLDEAHSVGALGPSGRGVVEYWGCQPEDVDIMMGTLTKSFAAAGGYIAGAKKTIEYIRVYSTGSCYGQPMSPPVIAQVMSSMKIMCGEDGTDIGRNKAIQLLRNTRYFRAKLKAMGFMVYGHGDSPVVPLMTFFTPKVVFFGRETLRLGIGTVSVGYPATPLTKSRVRFCISADHTKEQLDYVIAACDLLGDVSSTKYGKAERHKLGTIVY